MTELNHNDENESAQLRILKYFGQCLYSTFFDLSF